MPRLEDHLLIQERIPNKWDHEWDGKLKAHLQRVADMSWNVRGGISSEAVAICFERNPGGFLEIKVATHRPPVYMRL
jgi:hypothetical protein